MKGTVVSVEKSHIVLEVMNIGYKLIVHNPSIDVLNQKLTFYIYQQVLEKEFRLYGFESKMNKEMFLIFMSVKGVGVQIAFNLALCSYDKLLETLSNNDVNFFCTFPKVGKKLANQIIIQLNSCDFEQVTSLKINKELHNILLTLGYTDSEIGSYLRQNKLTSNIDYEVNKFILHTKKRT